MNFENSLTAVAQVALNETKAIGYALFERVNEAPGLRPLSSLGEEIPPNATLSRAVVALPLRTNGVSDGVAAFSFADQNAAALAQEPLRRLLEAMQTIWGARYPDAHYLRLFGRISALESQLIDSKIADRAHGLLQGERSPDVFDSLVRHVKTVLRPGSVSRTIEAVLKELEDEIEERRVTGQAKAILQATHSFSEEQAYTHLRVLSRKSRRRLREVAQDVMDDLAVPTNAR